MRNRWREIKKPDGTPVTDADATNLQVGQELCIPNGFTTPPPFLSGNGFAGIMSHETFEAMFPNRNGFYSYDGLVAVCDKYLSKINCVLSLRGTKQSQGLEVFRMLN
ncbi:MAG: hypothetical protein WBF90_12930 [Rivularia sp. (in: cyanobacteria)]